MLHVAYISAHALEDGFGDPYQPYIEDHGLGER